MSITTTQSIYRKVILAGDYWSHVIKKGQNFTIVDLEGNQAADTMFYNAKDTLERYSAQDTIRHQNNVYLTIGSELISNLGNVLLTITEDTCGRHDTLGGACAAESNSVRYPLDKRHMHNCRDNFMAALREFDVSLGKNNLNSNINFFMNVPISPDGKSTFSDGISAPGKYVQLKAEMDVLCIISNCPQLNNPCNAYNPTPIEVIISEP
ncbi:urea amidolyase associated protein UAAP2 [Ulvibacterium sp.]|uniref:urea amidolyase associated protein UAAP2 n=1 Tax=Ulvibacterium sp. TaxID=2665914 RepID=UPI002613309C|nr:urea amidolyase associated protein UAAP2 [Ulvibacterium sp.]